MVLERGGLVIELDVSEQLSKNQEKIDRAFSPYRYFTGG